MVTLAVYGVIAVAGVAGGLLIGHVLSKRLGEAAPEVSLLNRVAGVLAALFASEVVPEDATAEDRERIFKNAVATAGLGVMILVILSLGTGGPLAFGSLIGGGILIVLGAGQALVVYGEKHQSNASSRRTR